MIYTDKTDKFSPTVGYLPGPMPWFLQEKLEKLGVEVDRPDLMSFVTTESTRSGDNFAKYGNSVYR